MTYVWKVGDVTTTRDGRNARIICVDAINYEPIVALVFNSNGKEDVITYKADGSFVTPNSRMSRDLMVPTVAVNTEEESK